MGKSLMGLFKTFIISASLLIFQMPAFGQEALLSDVLKSMMSTSEDAKISSITMDAVGAVTSHLSKYKMTADVQLATSGGAAFVKGESITAQMFDQVGDDLAAQAEELGTGDKAAEAQGKGYLSSLKSSYGDTSDVLSVKKYFQESAATAYTAAAAAALEMSKREMTEIEKCQKPVSDAFKACEPSQKSADSVEKALQDVVLARSDDSKSIEGAEHSKTKRLLTAEKLTALKADLVKSATQYESDAAMATSAENIPEAEELTEKATKCTQASTPLLACDKLMKMIDDDEVFGTLTLIGQNSPTKLFTPIKSLEKNKSYLNNILNLFFPEARADLLSSLLDMGPETSAAFVVITTNLGDKVDSLLLSPTKRVIIWELLARLATMSAEATQHEIDQVEESARKTNKVIEKLEQQSTFINNHHFQNFLNFLISPAAAQTKLERSKNLKNAIKASKNEKMACLASAGNTNCRPLTNLLPQSPGFSILPAEIKIVARQIVKVGDDASTTSGPLSPAAMINLKGVASKRAAMASYFEKTKNSEKKNSGLGLSYDQLEGELMNSFQAITSSALKKFNISPSKYLASYGGTSFSKTDAKTSGKAMDKAKETISPNNEPMFSDRKKTVTDVLNTAKEDKIKRKMYAAGTMDINTNSSQSIFEMISNRYLKSFVLKLPADK